MVIFSNDGPLGQLVSGPSRVPDSFTGAWNSNNWVGYYVGDTSPDLTYLFLWLVGPFTFAKFYTPLCLFFLGMCAWVFFRSLRLSPAACLLGALAATLNSEFFSTACWGVAGQCLSFGLSYLALAALADPHASNRWLRVVLAGSAVGVSIMEGFDIAAIFSLFVAAFAMYQALVTPDGAWPKRLVVGGLRTGVVALVSAIVAFHAISMLIGTQIEGIVGMQQDEQTKATRWNEATQWSLPKKELLGVAVPGLFGYRMDTPDGGEYWGQGGRTPGWEEHHQGTARFKGNGFYAGMLVVVVAAWALVQSFRKKDSVFGDLDRRWLWFWGGVVLVSVLLAFGRYAPFYQFFYALPYFSTIRNPDKFMHVASWALVVLFAYGIHGLFTIYTAAKTAAAEKDRRSWWQRLSGFDRKWVVVSAVVLGASCVAWLIYGNAKGDLEQFLVKEAIGADQAPMVAAFSIRQAGVGVLLLAVALGLVTLLLAGFFRGPRAKWAGVILGLFLVLDLGRANLPWIVYWNAPAKYASNPVLDLLREKPYEHRVAVLPFPMPNELSLLSSVYRGEWHQQQFPYYNIQSLDIVQMRAKPADIASFEKAFYPDPSQPKTVARFVRLWELTNTRYLLGPAGFVDVMNRQLDPVQQRFRVKMAFDLVPKPGVMQITSYAQFTAKPNENGRYAVIEFTGALPRASLYTHWQIQTNDAVTLQTLADPTFDPHSTVLVANTIAPSPEAVSTNSQSIPAAITSYAPKRVELQATNETPAVLLLNDKYDPNWKLTVDGQSAEVLRCNYTMRGAYLEPGAHTLVFTFAPPERSLYVTGAALGISILLLGVLIVSNTKGKSEETANQH